MCQKFNHYKKRPCNHALIARYEPYLIVCVRVIPPHLLLSHHFFMFAVCALSINRLCYRYLLCAIEVSIILTQWMYLTISGTKLCVVCHSGVYRCVGWLLWVTRKNKFVFRKLNASDKMDFFDGRKTVGQESIEMDLNEMQNERMYAKNNELNNSIDSLCTRTFHRKFHFIWCQLNDKNVEMQMHGYFSYHYNIRDSTTVSA